MVRKRTLIAVVLAALAADLVGCPRPDGAGKTALLRAVRVDDAAKTAGETVRYAVRVEETAEAVKAFGLDVHYDPALLRYTGQWERGELTQGFTQLDVNEVEPGVLRLGGFTVGEGVPAAVSGVLAQLVFESITFTPSQLSVSAPVDDVENFAVASVSPAAG